ncbi:hypothetical protein YTPLAS18_29470 [Nitrospira sp.]|nr:hypothetical protein YTPLAS18_29470 [Nitrospira sp.]
MDAFYVEPSIKSQTTTFSGVGFGSTALVTGRLQEIKIETIGVGIDLKLRAPIDTSPEYPGGRIQPTVSVGPALMFTRVEDTNNFSPGRQDDTDTRVGLKVGAGVTAMLTPAIGVFVEYRYLWYQAKIKTVDTNLPGASIQNDLTIQNHAILGGLSFRFGYGAAK